MNRSAQPAPSGMSANTNENTDRLLDAFRKAGFDDVAVSDAEFLIHFTDRASAETIAREGFLVGSPFDCDLRHTTARAHAAAGVNFAFDTTDAYSIMTLCEYDFGMDVDAALVFRAPGVSMSHYDGFRQVAFHGADVVGPFHLIIADSETDDDREPHERRWRTPDGNVHAGLFDAIDAIETSTRHEITAKKDQP